MKEVTGDLWTYPADVRVITTNGTVKRNGEAVMGRGCAAEAKQRWPKLPRELGRLIRSDGNHVHVLVTPESLPFRLASFPVKHSWYEKADLDLIERSAEELLDIASNLGNVFVLPRPGCGNGKLSWGDVRPVLEEMLDDRFHIITWGTR